MEGIRVVPFGHVDAALLLDLIDMLSLKFDGPVTAGREAEVPAAAFDAGRNQYLAGAFLERLREIPDRQESKLLGITEADIYGTGLNFVFGQADVGGRASVISLARLFPEGADGDGERLLRERVL